MRHDEDQGVKFGTWPDPTAQLMYHDIMPLALSGIDTAGRVADYGGANGLLKRFIPHAITVDYDETKSPTICDDILRHRGTYDLIVMRYVLHYMNNEDVRRLFRHLGSFHKGRILLIQFVNDDDSLLDKLHNSVGETKWFRGEGELRRLIVGPWQIASRKAVDYRVGADFYRWRLDHPNPCPHDETVVIYELERRGEAL